jgi:hypothetical protein
MPAARRLGHYSCFHNWGLNKQAAHTLVHHMMELGQHTKEQGQRMKVPGQRTMAQEPNTLVQGLHSLEPGHCMTALHKRE